MKEVAGEMKERLLVTRWSISSLPCLCNDEESSRLSGSS
jgi:hypothetical protein